MHLYSHQLTSVPLFAESASHVVAVSHSMCATSVVPQVATNSQSAMFAVAEPTLSAASQPIISTTVMASTSTVPPCDLSSHASCSDADDEEPSSFNGKFRPNHSKIV